MIMWSGHVESAWSHHGCHSSIQLKKKRVRARWREDSSQDYVPLIRNLNLQLEHANDVPIRHNDVPWSTTKRVPWCSMISHEIFHDFPWKFPMIFTVMCHSIHSHIWLPKPTKYRHRRHRILTISSGRQAMLRFQVGGCVSHVDQKSRRFAHMVITVESIVIKCWYPLVN